MRIKKYMFSREEEKAVGFVGYVGLYICNVLIYLYLYISYLPHITPQRH